MLDRRTSTVALRRLRAVLCLRGETILGLARRLSVSDAHLRAVMLGERCASARLREALVAELGRRAWAFVRGSVNVLSAG